MPSDLKKKTALGMLWSTIERFSTQGVQFIFGIILARILEPKDYGIIAMLTIFLAISQTFIDSGFGNAIVRKPDRTEKDKCTVFFFNLIMSFVCYGILFFSAPFIASFYGMPELCLILRILALRLIIQSVNTIQYLTLTIALDFKAIAKISLFAAILSGFAGIYFAYTGHGVFALVYQSLISSALTSVFYFFVAKWHPTSFISKESFKNLFSYGSKLLLSGLIDKVYTNIYPLVIGKFYTPAELGGYSKASHFASFPSSNLTSILQRVSFPVLSKLLNDKEKLRNGYLKFLNASSFLIFPLMLGLLALAKPLVLLVLTEKWSGMILILQILCLSMMWYPIHAINLNMLQVLGRSDLFLKLEIIKKIIGIIILCATLPFGILVLCYGKILNTFICLFINTYYSKKLMNAGLSVQAKFLVPTFINSCLMAALIIAINSVLPFNYLWQIIISFFVGILYYFGVNYLFNRKMLSEFYNIFKKK